MNCYFIFICPQVMEEPYDTFIVGSTPPATADSSYESVNYCEDQDNAVDGSDNTYESIPCRDEGPCIPASESVSTSVPKETPKRSGLRNVWHKVKQRLNPKKSPPSPRSKYHSQYRYKAMMTATPELAAAYKAKMVVSTQKWRQKQTPEWHAAQRDKNRERSRLKR